MPALDEFLIDHWWSAQACRAVTVAESTYRHLFVYVFDRRMNSADARTLAALLTGLSADEPVGVDDAEAARACGVSPHTVRAVLARLRDVGLVTKHFRGVQPENGRSGWSWRLSGGLFHVEPGAAVLIIEPTYDAARRMVEVHARSARAA